MDNGHSSAKISIGVGIIGTGSIAHSHALAVNAIDETALTSILSRDEKRGFGFLKALDVSDGSVHTSLDNFVSDSRIDLVIICSPDALHAKQAAKCLARGKHVLVEKPMTTSAHEATDLVKLAQVNRRTIATGFRLRFHEGHRLLHERVVRQDAIGAVQHIRTIWAYPQEDDSNWRARGEVGKWWSLAAVGTHCIDLARWFAGDENNDWKQFSSIISKESWNGPHDETAVIAGQLSTGTTVEVVSSVNFGPYSRLELFGDSGIATGEATMGREGGGEICIDGKPLVFESRNPFISQLRDIIESIRDERSPYSNGAVGLRGVQDLLLVSNV